ncbi:MAG: hypothetical protein NTU97_05000 [Candidatus Magasanikbacteria bacterium]|nr:hypothetical protein [Candidatus Magasanikbacteria bacterium]
MLSIGGGLSLGLLINPYFPHNLLFYWQQIIQIGLVNYQNTIQVGMEWYPYDPLELLANNIFIFLLGILSFVFLLYKIKYKQQIESQNIKERFLKIFTLFIFSGILCLLTLKSQRFVEYFSPFAVLASAFLLNLLWPANFSIKNKILKNFKKNTKINAALTIYLATVFIFFFILNTLKIQEQMTARYQWNYLQEASLWLKNNTPAGSMVFNVNWGDWPILFYHNTHNTYIIGLDPTFFYLKNKELYQEWKDVGQGKIRQNLAEKIKKDFGAQWILVKNSEIELLSAIRKNKNFKLRFADKDAKIYSSY